MSFRIKDKSVAEVQIELEAKMERFIMDSNLRKRFVQFVRDQGGGDNRTDEEICAEYRESYSPEWLVQAGADVIFTPHGSDGMSQSPETLYIPNHVSSEGMEEEDEEEDE